MGRTRSSYELQELLDKAKRREAELEKRRIEKIRNPQPTPATATLFYRDLLQPNKNLFYQVEVRERALQAFVSGSLTAGRDKAGLLADAPEGATIIELTKGSKIALLKVKWFYGDASVSVSTTSWGTVVRKPYDVQGSYVQSHFSIPFSVKGQQNFTINTAVQKFEEWAAEEGTKNNVIGVNGRAELIMGYGNQYTTLARATA
ncbi:MAG: hypothetical protein QNJ51_03040 [Calothrix sp. MO_167.B12]|nr:hypothetical protein [Calothrix sp. MO_167.B12]